jgi:hypothetical protein
VSHTYEDLKKKTVAELREIAKGTEHEAVQGFSQMNKEHLLPALCTALGIDAREHHVAHGAEKTQARARMHELKKKRQEAIAAGDHDQLRSIRREYHHWNHLLRVDARRPETA